MGKQWKKIGWGLLVMAMTFGMSNWAFDLIRPVRAEETDMHAIYALEYRDGSWSDWVSGGRALTKPGSLPVALKIGLENQPEGMTGTIQYQVNVSGFGWTDPFENAAVAGQESADAMLEGVRVWLNGELEQHYDVYTSALVNGAWLDWTLNGQDAGKVGVGTHMDGMCVTITKKGEQPKEKPAQTGRTLDPARPMVALTFDDGPSSYDLRIMNALEAVGGRGTFFMIGQKVPRRRDIVERMCKGGHELGNHSWNHPDLTKLSSAQVASQIQNTNNAIAAIAGHPATVMRPPYGAVNGTVKATLASMGYAASLWSIDTLDWKTRNADNTVNTVLKQVRDGDVVLMHSLYEASTVAAERIIPELSARGYQLVTLTELANARGGMTPGRGYGAFR